MAVGRKISGSRNLILFICIYIILCGIFNSKTRKTSSISIWEKLCVCVEVPNAINFFKAFKRRRTLKQRPLANRLKLIIGLRFILYTSYSVFLIMLSGDVEINPGPRCKEKDSVKCVTINARSLTRLVKFNNSSKSESNLVYSEDFGIVCVNETWLSANVYNAEILHLGYTIVRNDRITRGGGALLGVKTSTFKSVLHLPWMNGDILHNTKKKNSIRMRMKRSRLPSQNLKDRFRGIRRKIKQMLRESRLNYINAICSVREQNSGETLLVIFQNKN